jgi:beta-lactamase superfamily II metal-dependent hydrolase
MSYQAEKRKIEEKIKRIKTVVLCVLLAALLSLCIFSAFVPPDTWKYHVGKPSVSKRNEGELRIHFLDVGQGDCTLIEFPDGKAALIDGGDGRERTETSVMRYLNALEIDVIDYLIVTHADGDHCGSLDKILEHKTVLNAYLPTANPEKGGAEYAEFYEKLLEEDCSKKHSFRYLSLGTEAYTFTFLYPYSLEASKGMEELEADDNANSAVLWLDYLGVSALFTGDAPFETEELLMLDHKAGLFDHCGVALKSTEILKVAHHGSRDATSFEFLKYLGVKTAVISCGKDNVYGHPSEEAQENLKYAKAAVYRTDEQGTVMITIHPSGEYSIS